MTKPPNSPEETGAPDLEQDSRSYRVGYARPPLASRFQPGRSGNPKGRPKGAKNLDTLVREKLGSKVTVREGGRERRMSKGEIGVTKLVNRFVETGDFKLYLALSRSQDASGAGRASDSGAGDASTADQVARDEAIVNWFRAQHCQAEGENHE